MAVEAVRKTDIPEPEERRRQAYAALDAVLDQTPLDSTEGLAFSEQVELVERTIARDKAQAKVLTGATTGNTKAERSELQQAQSALAQTKDRIKFNSSKGVLIGYGEAKEQFSGFISHIKQAEMAVSPTRERTFLEFGLLDKVAPYRPAVAKQRPGGWPSAKAA